MPDYFLMNAALHLFVAGLQPAREIGLWLEMACSWNTRFSARVGLTAIRRHIYLSLRRKPPAGLALGILTLRLLAAGRETCAGQV
jgi:hypothetical protein